VAKAPKIEPGQIYWLNDCPPLDGTRRERRPVIVVFVDDDDGNAMDRVIIVPTTTHPTRDPDRIVIAGLDQNPDSPTGLPKTCIALPRWFFPVERDHLWELMGRLPAPLLQRLEEAVEARLDCPDDWEEAE
jgi:mRNA-degrading endonuclease toxin of MazEF toxin-antitoxin module